MTLIAVDVEVFALCPRPSASRGRRRLRSECAARRYAFAPGQARADKLPRVALVDGRAGGADGLAAVAAGDVQHSPVSSQGWRPIGRQWLDVSAQPTTPCARWPIRSLASDGKHPELRDCWPSNRACQVPPRPMLRLGHLLRIFPTHVVHPALILVVPSKFKIGFMAVAPVSMTGGSWCR
jgi:hypothetical protein